MIEETTIQAVKAVNIMDVIRHYVDLKRKGANYLGLCPFHDEKTGSFTVSPAKDLFKCFGCGKSGDGIKFIMEHEKLSYPEAISLIAGLNNIPVDQAEYRAEAIKRKLIKSKKPIREGLEFDTIPFSLIPEPKDHIYKNPLTKQLAAIYGAEIVEAVIDQYEITINGNWLVFPQKDIKGRFRTVKGIRYENNGHRDHNALPMWLHASLKKAAKLPDAFRLKQCFTGEHLINQFHSKTIAIVEGQSTALYMACLSMAAQQKKIKSLEYFTRFIWICTGGSDGIGWKKEGIADVLRNRKVIAFPDAGFYDQWLSDAEELQETGINIGVSELIEKKFKAGKVQHNDDLRDFLEGYNEEIKSYFSAIQINEGDIKLINVPSIAGPEYGCLRLYEIRLANGSLFEILADEDGEIITAHERLHEFTTFFKRELQPGKFNGIDCLINIIHNKT
jgi:hypothetical protein